jgi:hypothetical protein
MKPSRADLIAFRFFSTVSEIFSAVSAGSLSVMTEGKFVFLPNTSVFGL